MNQAILLLMHLDDKSHLIDNLLQPIYPKESEDPTEIYINRYKLKPYLEQL